MKAVTKQVYHIPFDRFEPSCFSLLVTNPLLIKII